MQESLVLAQRYDHELRYKPDQDLATPAQVREALLDFDRDILNRAKDALAKDLEVKSKEKNTAAAKLAKEKTDKAATAAASAAAKAAAKQLGKGAVGAAGGKPGAKGQPRVKGACFICGLAGHHQGACPSKPADPYVVNSYNAGNPVDSGRERDRRNDGRGKGGREL